MDSFGHLASFGQVAWLRLEPHQFSDAMLAGITDAVSAAEQDSATRIRVMVRAGFDTGVTDVREQARRDFEALELEAADHRRGLLLLFVLRAKTFTILADEGITARIPDDEWEAMKGPLASHFHDVRDFEGYAQSVCAVVVDVGKRLAASFPKRLE